MAFMEMFTYHGGYYRVETPSGDFIVPDDLVGSNPSPDDFLDFCPEGVRYPSDTEGWEVKHIVGWYGRYSAPGYMDCTDWEAADTEAELVESLRDLYGDDSDDESELDEESRLDSERQAERDEEGSNWIDGPTAIVVQKFGAVRKEYGPFPVAIGPDFDECGLERSVLEEVTRAARIEGAEIGYCDVIIHDADGNELDTETAVI